jgi:hypothetical protein
MSRQSSKNLQGSSDHPDIIVEPSGIDADSDADDIYMDEPTEIPPPPPTAPQQAVSPSKRNKTPKRTVAIETEWEDAEFDRRYDLTPLEGLDTNRRSSTPTTPSYTIDPWEVALEKKAQQERASRDAEEE